MRMVEERIARLIDITDSNHAVDCLSHRSLIADAIKSLPPEGRTAIGRLEDSHISVRSLIDLGACILAIRLCERDIDDIRANCALYAMHAVMGATIAMDGGYCPQGQRRDDPDCMALVEEGIVQVCLDIACRAPSSTLSCYARRLVGLATVNLAVAGSIEIRQWDEPSSTLDDMAAMAALALEAKPGFYHDLLTPDDVWSAFNDTVLLVERHGACTREALADLVARENSVSSHGRLLH